ncbi:MAG: hypothetical protein ACTS5I_02540, partial [Rhodanobacter sp.]
GSTGEVREVSASVHAHDEQEAVSKLMGMARRDDYYYRFLGRRGVLTPGGFDDKLEHDGQTYFVRH